MRAELRPLWRSEWLVEFSGDNYLNQWPKQAMVPAFHVEGAVLTVAEDGRGRVISSQ